MRPTSIRPGISRAVLRCPLCPCPCSGDEKLADHRHDTGVGRGTGGGEATSSRGH